MQIVTPEQMKRIELRSEEMGVSRAELMKNAGKALAELIDEYCREAVSGQPEDKSVVFLAGSGNNGGDCFAAASRLVYRGYRVTVINFCGKPQTELASAAFERLPGERITIITAYRSESVKAAIEAAELDYMTLSRENDLSVLTGKKELTPLEKIMLEEKKRADDIYDALKNADVIADGVFGTGFHGQLDTELASFLSAECSAYKIAVDVPSGGNCMTGEISEGSFSADETLALGAIKTGMTQYPLKSLCGKISVADIGIPSDAYNIFSEERSFTLLDKDELAGFPRMRDPDSHKGSFGRVLCITGSSSMRGAAALSALGALKSGAGLVCVASCEKCIDAVSVLAPEATFLPLECDDYGYILFDCNKRMLETELAKADAVLIGCGMGVTPDTAELVRFVAKNANCPIIIDADGINCMASDIDILLKKKTDLILTPHPGEMAGLCGCTAGEINRARFSSAAGFAEKYGVTVVLKGAGTVIAGAHDTSVNQTGNPGMSKGGSGDVLAGMIASFAAQGYDVYDAARFAVYVHGLAGDIAAEKFGHEAMLPRDIIGALSDSFRILSEMNIK